METELESSLGPSVVAGPKKRNCPECWKMLKIETRSKIGFSLNKRRDVLCNICREESRGNICTEVGKLTHGTAEMKMFKEKHWCGWVTCQESLTGLLRHYWFQDLIFVVSTTLPPFSADSTLYHKYEFWPFVLFIFESSRNSSSKEDQILLVRAESCHVHCPKPATGTIARTATQAQQHYYFWLYLLLYISKLFLCPQKSFLPAINTDKINCHSCKIFPTSS